MSEFKHIEYYIIALNPSDDEIFGMQMVSVDQLLMTKACEVFLKDLTNLALLNAKEKNERIVKPCDVVKAIKETDRMDFLKNVASDVKVSSSSFLFIYLYILLQLFIYNIYLF